MNRKKIKVNYCEICKSVKIKKINVGLPFFRHLDFTTISDSGNLYRCSNCQIIYNPCAVANELATFKSEVYAKSAQTQQKINSDEFSGSMSRSFLQAKILADRFIQNKRPKILDIGCFKGHLLLELDSILNKGIFWGYDINPQLKNLFSDKDNFQFISSNLEDIDVRFDLIILSHSIPYVPDLSKLMKSIDQLLDYNGILFIQIPNISKNLFYSLMGDQCFIFTQASLMNLLMNFGYSIYVIEDHYFPRELLIVSKKEKKECLMNFEQDSIFERNIQILKEVKDKLYLIDGNQLAVLGTTVNAAFVDEVIGERIEYFVDENLSNRGKIFRGKHVVHPNSLNKKHRTILPYGESGLRIKERFNSLYRGEFILI